MVIDKAFLDELSKEARNNPRLRKNYDLRDNENDESQRMLNAIEPGTIIPIHRHPATSEDVVVLRGIAEEVFFDSDGNETGRFRLIPGSSSLAIHIPQGIYHQLCSLETGTVVFSCKNTKYDPNGTEELSRP